jgi:hypothetical protein
VLPLEDAVTDRDADDEGGDHVSENDHGVEHLPFLRLFLFVFNGMGGIRFRGRRQPSVNHGSARWPA